MAEFMLDAAPILGGVDRRIGDNRILERDDLACVSIAIPIAGETILQAALERAWSLAIPEPNMSLARGGVRICRTAPDQLLALFPHDTPDANGHIQDRLKSTGYTTDQTDARVILELAGPDTFAALERLCPLDLHEAVFPVNAAAQTAMEHLSTLIVRLGPESFLLMSARSSAASFLHGVETSYQYVL